MQKFGIFSNESCNKVLKKRDSPFEDGEVGCKESLPPAPVQVGGQLAGSLTARDLEFWRARG